MDCNKFKDEYDVYQKMKRWYPNSLKDSTFEKEFEAAIEGIQGQLGSGCIDVSNGNCDELAYFIINKSIQEYVEKHNLKEKIDKSKVSK